MQYFITGGTGFIGGFLVKKLLARGGTVHVLVRDSSLEKFTRLQESFGVDAERVHAVIGDLTAPNLGLSAEDRQRLEGRVDHFFHLAAIYDLQADSETQELANIEGTHAAVNCAKTLGAGYFHHVSSIAAAGLYKGIFREDMFEEAENLDDPYLRTKHMAEKIVREQCGEMPYKIYRPGMVVGHSKTGEVDKIDGPYYFFKMLQKLRNALPQWMPTIGLEGGRLNIVPVDYVVDAMDAIAHTNTEVSCFHLTDPEPYRVGEVLNIFAEAGHAPRMAMRIDSRLFGFIPKMIRDGITRLPPIQRMRNAILEDMGIPAQTLKFIAYPTKFDNRETERVLRGTGIKCPRLTSYAAPVWDYWERNLDPDLFVDRTLKGRVKDKVIMVTGATSGIGQATALKLATTEAKILLVARTPEKLEETLGMIQELGGQAFIYQCDISDLSACDQLVKDVINDHGGVDILINNAGRSIRRSLSLSFDRFHDFERTMQLNYFGALKLIMGFSEKMLEQRSGHIINISSIGVQTNAPRFSAYVASKAALDAFSRCAAAEFSDRNVKFTTINMPLVRTPMIGPTKIYDSVPALKPEEAADLVCEAIINRPKRIATRLGTFAQVMHAIAPRMSEIIMNTGFKMFPDSAAAKGEDPKKPQTINSEQVAFAALMRGIHW